MEKVIDQILTSPGDKISGYSKEIVDMIGYLKTAETAVLSETSPQNIGRKSISLNGYRCRLGQIVAELNTVYEQARADRKQAWASAFALAAVPGSDQYPDGTIVKKITTGDYCKAKADMEVRQHIGYEIRTQELLKKAENLREDISEELYLFQSHAGNMLRENEKTGSIYGQGNTFGYKPNTVRGSTGTEEPGKIPADRGL